MKRNIKTLFIGVLSLLAVTGCNKTAASSSNSSSSSNSNSTQDSVSTSSASDSTSSSNAASSSSSSSSKPVAEDNYLEPYDVNIALENYEVTITTSTQTVDIYGKDAIYVDSGSDAFGYIYFENSLWEYSFGDDNSVALESCIYGSIDENYDLTSLITYYSAIDILKEDFSGSNWVAQQKAHTYTTTDAKTISALLALGGYSSSSSSSYSSTTYSATSLTMTAKSTGYVTITGNVTATTTSYFSGSTTETVKLSMILSNLGDNSNDAITSFLANPTVPTQTAFADELKTGMTTFSGSVLPYDSKFTSYSNYSVSTSSYSYQDMKCGDLVTEYGAKLVEAGFTKDTTAESTSGATSYAKYTKMKSAKTATSGQSDYVIYLAYYSTSDLSSNGGEILYKDGVFLMQGTIVTQALQLDNVADINAFVAGKLKKSDGSAIIPDITFTPATIALADFTAYAAMFGYSVTAWYEIEGTFNTGAEALSSLKAYATSLVNAGFTIDTSSDDSSSSAAQTTPTTLSEENNEITYVIGDENSPAGEFIGITISLGTEDSDDDDETSSSTATPATLDGSFSINIIAL